MFKRERQREQHSESTDDSQTKKIRLNQRETASSFCPSRQFVALSPLVANIVLRPRNFQWYWNSAKDPWNPASAHDWVQYRDVTNEIIEDAYLAKKNEIEIDGDYIVKPSDNVQCSKVDESKQRQIKRVVLDSNSPSIPICLRSERYSTPIYVYAVPILTADRNDSFRLESTNGGPDFPATYWSEGMDDIRSLADIVKRAALGLIKEGTDANEIHTAEKLAEQLREVRQFGKNLGRTAAIPDEIGQVCICLYTRDSFWYALINSVMRSERVTRSNLETLGPFAYLLTKYLKQIATTQLKTVYRGFKLTNEGRQVFIQPKKYIFFSTFTSTSTNRTLAEMFGDTLLIIDLNIPHEHYNHNIIPRGADIRYYSVFPDEEEFLIWPASKFEFIKYEKDGHKHLIYLRSSTNLICLLFAS